LVSKLDESLDRQRVEAEKQVRRSLWLGAYLLTGAGAVLILLAFVLFEVVLPAMNK
jgi:hypothetical protein